jgi:hypothetical protein
MDRDFLLTARETYLRANMGTLNWMLDRPRLHRAFLNTKLNSLTLRDYGENDGWRSPAVVYGWIQGRGLEALVLHARFFEARAPELAAKLRSAAHDLYRALADLHARHGRAYFAYNAELCPVYPGSMGEMRPQASGEGLSTYSDIFVVKGLIAASQIFDQKAMHGYLENLRAIVLAVDEDRFLMNERQRLDQSALARQQNEYGPRMILLGAAAMLHELGHSANAAFAERLIEHVLREHVEDGSGQLRAGATRDTPDEDHCNPGHAIEFVGFALECLTADADRARVQLLEQMLLTSFALGFEPPGIALSVSLSQGTTVSEYRPWWSLPETIRAAARAFERTNNPASFGVWRSAHQAFFRHYWRSDPPIAFQTLTKDGPIDYVPATPDLDPGYHTGLSFLGTLHVIERLLSTGRHRA